MIPTYARAKHCLNRSQTTLPMITVQDTCQKLSARAGRQVGARVYRVYYVQDTVEHYEGFYETQEEAEEVAVCVSDDYEPERVEVRDRFDNIVFVIDDEVVVT